MGRLWSGDIGCALPDAPRSHCANGIVLSASETPHGASLQWKYPLNPTPSKTSEAAGTSDPTFDLAPKAEESSRSSVGAFDFTERSNFYAERFNIYAERTNHSAERVNHSAEWLNDSVERANDSAEWLNNSAERANFSAERTDYSAVWSNDSVEWSNNSVFWSNDSAEWTNFPAERLNYSAEPASCRGHLLSRGADPPAAPADQPSRRRHEPEHLPGHLVDPSVLPDAPRSHYANGIVLSASETPHRASLHGNTPFQTPSELESRAAKQRCYLEQLSLRVDVTVLASKEMWR